MAGEMVPFGGTGGLVARRDQRVVAREIARLDVKREVGLAKVEVQAELAAARAHAVGYVAQQGMQAVAMVSQLEGQLGQACPLAVTRLQGIADMGAMGVAQIVSDVVWKTRK